MSTKKLNELKWQRPFKPFRVRTVNDEVFEITDPGLILVGKNGVNIGIPHPDEPPPRVREVIPLAADDITAVELIESVST